MNDEKYAALKYYLNNTLESFPDEMEIEQLVYFAVRSDAHEHNVGIFTNRLEHNPREKSFHDHWLKENRPLPYINNGHGILQDLFIESEGVGIASGIKTIEKINNRDRMIVATVIQWLGSNCGMCFLGEVLQEFGAKIAYPAPAIATPSNAETKIK